MKKWLVRIGIALVVLVIAAVLGVRFFLDSAIKKGVETVGPMVTKVTVKLDSVSVSILSGSGSMRGLVVGNPEGFKTPAAISVGSASLSLVPASVLNDKVVIKSINIKAPEITFESGLRNNNLSAIMANIDSFTGPSSESGSQRKLQVDEVLVSDGKIHVSITTLAGRSLTVPLPTIHLTNLGQGPEGITAADLTRKILGEIEKNTVQAAAGSVADLGKETVGMVKDAGKAAVGNAEKTVKGLGGLFKK